MDARVSINMLFCSFAVDDTDIKGLFNRTINNTIDNLFLADEIEYQDRNQSQ